MVLQTLAQCQGFGVPTHENETIANTWRAIVSTPLRLGGVGLANAAANAPNAYLASVADATKLILTLPTFALSLFPLTSAPGSIARAPLPLTPLIPLTPLTSLPICCTFFLPVSNNIASTNTTLPMMISSTERCCPVPLPTFPLSAANSSADSTTSLPR